MTTVNTKPILKAILHLLAENQASDIVSIDVHDQTTITDDMVICSGRSSRHVKAIAENTMEQMKIKGFSVLGESGLQTADWVLLDFGDVVVHVMQPTVRAYYHLEGLWQHE
jgi:ribosome-associated protein